MSEDQLYDEVYFIMRELRQSFDEIMAWSRRDRHQILKRHIARLKAEDDARKKASGLV